MTTRTVASVGWRALVRKHASLALANVRLAQPIVPVFVSTPKATANIVVLVVRLVPVVGLARLELVNVLLVKPFVRVHV